MDVEPILLILSLLFFVSIFADKAGSKLGVPALLVFLAVGMLFGEDGPVGIDFSNTALANAVGSVALCIILFEGALGTDFQNIRPVLKEGITLATLGVILTCLFCGVTLYYLFRWFAPVEAISLSMSLLIAATMSSTDAGSVFSILRGKGVNLKHNLGPLLELESGSNDPIAYILVTILMSINTGSVSVMNDEYGAIPFIIGVIIIIFIQVALGLLVGYGFGKGIVWLMRHVSLNNTAFYPILTLAACIFIYSLTAQIHGNAYLAVYVGGLVIGNSKFTKKRLTINFFNGLSWLSQLIVFLMLGLLVSPHTLPPMILPAILISLVMIGIARPLSMHLSLWPFRQYKREDKLFVSWVGLKGAVPIILAIMCMDKGVPNADTLFNIIFICVLISLILQGSSLTYLADRLHLSIPNTAPPEPTHFDIDLPEEIRSVASEMVITDEQVGMNGKHLRDLRLPSNSLAIMVRRGDDFFVPSGQSIIEDGDIVLIVTDPEHALVTTYKNTIDYGAANEWENQLLSRTNIFLQGHFERRKRWWERILHIHSDHSSNPPSFFG